MKMTEIAAKRGMTMERLIERAPNKAAQAFREGYLNVVKGEPKGNFGRGNPLRFAEGQAYAKMKKRNKNAAIVKKRKNSKKILS